MLCSEELMGMTLASTIPALLFLSRHSAPSEGQQLADLFTLPSYSR